MTAFWDHAPCIVDSEFGLGFLQTSPLRDGVPLPIIFLRLPQPSTVPSEVPERLQSHNVFPPERPAFRLIGTLAQEGARSIVMATLVKDDSSVDHCPEGITISLGGPCLLLGFLQGSDRFIVLSEPPKRLAKIVERDPELCEKPVFPRKFGCPHVKREGLLAPP